jgi:hypothetical protein
MDADEKNNKRVKQPENMVYYKPIKELYSTVHACIILRELPELTAEELRQISEREQTPKQNSEGPCTSSSDADMIRTIK